MKVLTIRDDARFVDSGRGSYLIPAVLVKEHLIDRVRSLRPRDEITLNPGIIYAAYTGLQIPDVLPWDILVRPTPDSWKWGLTPVHWDSVDSGEFVVYFTSGESHAFNKNEDLFELIHLNRSTDAGVVVEQGESAPIPGHAPVQETKHLVERRPVQEQAPGQPEKNPEAALQEWLNTPDEFDGKVLDANASQDVPTRRELPAVKTADESRQSGPVEARDPAPESDSEGLSPEGVSQDVSEEKTAPELPPAPPAPPREVDGVDLTQLGK